ncbi:hypothetical protein CRG98_014996 [Punica granatum]|uniref:Uncharacterized protein n=1 Tax=Punica granatum TaxID=22663 RepID=A0A2I0K7P0_PUNGR|nr:hypothetical protein CRG98_014996 [Punica granatum]
MLLRRTTNQHRVTKEDELYRRIEQIIDTRLVFRLDVVLDRLTERIGALMEARQEVDSRRARVPNSTADLEDVEHDSYSEGDAILFSKEDLSDDAFFIAGGDGEPKFDEGDDKVKASFAKVALHPYPDLRTLLDLVASEFLLEHSR